MIHPRDAADADVIVVGAGPAGSTAALLLARAGLRVRLLDRAAFPRDKLCGDTLNPGCMAILDALSVPGGPEGPPLRVLGGPDGPALRVEGLGDRVRRVAGCLTGMTVTGPGGVSVSADYPDGLRGFAIARRDLDVLLVDAASGAGAQFEPGVRVEAPLLGRDGRGVTGVRVRCGHRTHDLSARLVIAADGRASKLVAGLRLGRFAPSPRRWAFGAYFDGVEGLRSHGEMHIRADGYIGVAPLPGGVANVCVVREASRGAAAPRVDQARAIGDAVGADPLLRGRFDRAIRRSEVMVLGPLSVEARAAGCPGLLLAGDAAGFVDPMTGDGMRFALRGAVLAAEAAMRELSSGSPAFGDLAAARTRAFAGKWRVNRALRALVGSPRALTLAALVAQRWSAPVEYLIGVAGDVPDAYTHRPRG